MTKPSDHDKEARLLEALDGTWARMEETFGTEPAPLPDWTAMVRERRHAARRKFWKELAIFWSLAIPVVGLLLLLVTGVQPLFWILEAGVTAAVIPLLIPEFHKAARSGGGGGAL
jgi:hypothetical protein